MKLTPRCAAWPFPERGNHPKSISGWTLESYGVDGGVVQQIVPFVVAVKADFP